MRLFGESNDLVIALPSEIIISMGRLFLEKIKAIWRKNSVPYYFTTPVVVLILSVIVLPIIYSFWLSTQKTDYVQPIGFVGLQNYIKIFTDPDIIMHFKASLQFVGGSLAVVIPFAIMLAVLLTENIKYQAFFRSIFILPWVISQVATALTWSWLYNTNFGPFTYLLKILGFEGIKYLGDPNYAMMSVIVANAWRTYPFALILIIAGLQSIPEQLLEAAKVDGANELQIFFRVKLPLIQDTLMNICILLSLLYFNTVTLILILTEGGPLNLTNTLALRTFKESFVYWEFSTGVTFGIIIFIINILFSLLYIKIIKRDR